MSARDTDLRQHPDVFHRLTGRRVAEVDALATVVLPRFAEAERRLQPPLPHAKRTLLATGYWRYNSGQQEGWTMGTDEEQAAVRLRLANGATIDDEVVGRLAPQLAEVATGLAALAERLPLESEPATVERVDERDW